MYYSLVYNAMPFIESQLAFRANISTPSSGSGKKPSKMKADGKYSSSNCDLKSY
jgi:hypothetical protein